MRVVTRFARLVAYSTCSYYYYVNSTLYVQRGDPAYDCISFEEKLDFKSDPLPPSKSIIPVVLDSRVEVNALSSGGYFPINFASRKPETVNLTMILSDPDSSVYRYAGSKVFVEVEVMIDSSTQMEVLWTVSVDLAKLLAVGWKIIASRSRHVNNYTKRLAVYAIGVLIASTPLPVYQISIASKTDHGKHQANDADDSYVFNLMLTVTALKPSMSWQPSKTSDVLTHSELLQVARSVDPVVSAKLSPPVSRVTRSLDCLRLPRLFRR